jgi:radical SAM protein with 4Fe4S-binding SPASM domain
MRQAYPDREAVRSWFRSNEMPIETIERVLEELWEIGYRGIVGLNHYNEPLLDKRLPQIARLARAIGHQKITTLTNGDFLTPQLATELDGVIARIGISLYEKEDRGRRKRRISSYFSKTQVVFTSALHRRTHWSSFPGLEKEIEKCRSRTCSQPARRFLINHRGDVLACCEEIVPHFGLGNVHSSSLEELWWGDRRRKLTEDLKHSGGRLAYPFCRNCPASNLKRRFEVFEVKEAQHEIVDCYSGVG